MQSAQTLRYGSQLQLSQLIYDFGRTGGSIDAAKAGARASVDDEQTVQTQLALNAASSFYSSLQAEALLEVAQRNLDQQRQRQAQAESFFKIGTRPEIDVLIARTAVAQAELQLAQSRTNVGVARVQLVQALGVPEPEWTGWLARRLSTELAPALAEEPAAMGPGNSVQVNDALIDEVLRDRPDYRALRERVVQNEQLLRSTRGSYFPQLQVSANASVGGLVNTLDIPGSAATTGLAQPIHGEPLLAISGQASLIWPLLSGLNTVYSVREAEALVRVARANLDAMRLQVRSVLLQVLVQVVTARESVNAAEFLVKQADLQLQMATGRYKAGVGNAIELGDAQVAATTAHGQKVQASFGLAMARATLLWNLGRLVAPGRNSPSEQASEQQTMTAEAGKKSKALLWVALVVLVVGAGLGIYRLVFYKPPGPKWVTAKVTRGPVAQIVSATGTLNPVVLSPVGAQVSGIVWKIHADFNSPVKKGQLLVELDPALFQSAVRREEANVAAAVAGVAKARADARNATVAATRARALVAQHYIALADRDTAVAQEQSAQAGLAAAEAGVSQAQANLEKVKLDLKNSVVLSPVDGVVIARSVELGQAVVASFQAPNLFTIAEDLKKMQVLANVDEADIGFIQAGATANFTVDSYRNRRFVAKVAQVRNAPQTVQNVVTYVVVLDVNNSELLLKPGMTANVRLDVASRPSALLIPSAALRFKPRLAGAGGGDSGRPRGAGRAEGDKPDGDKSGGKGGSTERAARSTVWVPEGEAVHPRSVVTGITDGNVTEIVSGLEENQVIVVEAARTGTSAAAPPTNPFAPAGMPRPGGGGGGRRGGI